MFSGIVRCHYVIIVFKYPVRNQFLPCNARHKQGLCCVRLSVAFVYSVEMNNLQNVFFIRYPHHSSLCINSILVCMTVSTVLDLTGNDGSSIHKQRTNVVDVMSPPPSAFCLLGSESSSTPAYAPPPPFQAELPAGDGLMCANVHKSFHWPGIDAVMESYQLYLEGNVSHCSFTHPLEGRCLFS